MQTNGEKVEALKKYLSKPHELQGIAIYTLHTEIYFCYSLLIFLFVADHCLLTPVEYRALHTVFCAYNSKKIMDVWRSVYHMRVVTFHIVMQLLRSKKLTIVARDLKVKFDKGMEIIIIAV